jgi:TonB family protein
MKSLELRCRRVSALLTLACGMALISPSPAQTVGETEQPQAVGAPLRTEAFQPVRVKNSVLPVYPIGLQMNHEEGWVNLSFMVSPEGKAYEVYVSESAGSKDFERAALRAIKDWTFEPAKFNGDPVDSAVSQKFKFSIPGGTNGARGEFVNSYRALQRAIENNDKVAADAAAASLHITNLFEDAYYGLAEYNYAARWGNEAQQVAGLSRAVAAESSAHYLPKPAFAAALQALLPLEIRAHDFASAMIVWDRMQNAGIDKKELAQLKPTIDKIEALRTDDKAYAVSGQIVESSWAYRLFKQHFQFTISEGHISDVKLLCDKKYVAFKFDPDLDYQVADKFGRCTIAIAGDPGTKFKLIQH